MCIRDSLTIAQYNPKILEAQEYSTDTKDAKTATSIILQDIYDRKDGEGNIVYSENTYDTLISHYVDYNKEIFSLEQQIEEKQYILARFQDNTGPAVSDVYKRQMHFHAEGPCAMTFLPRLFGIPVVSTIHGLDWQRAKWGRFASRYLLWGERNAARYSDALIVLSNGNQQYFTQTYGRETIYIPNGVSLIPCREPEEIGRRWNLSKNSYILFLSRLVPEKGLHSLIGA